MAAAIADAPVDGTCHDEGIAVRRCVSVCANVGAVVSVDCVAEAARGTFARTKGEGFIRRRQ